MPPVPVPLQQSAIHVDVRPGGEVILNGFYYSPSDASVIDAATTTWPPTAPGGESADAKGLFKAAIRDDDPVLFMESETLYGVKGEVPDDPDVLVPMGVASVAREGSDVTIVAWSRMVHVSLEAATALEKEGISAEVIDLRSLRPLDEQAIARSVTKTHRAVVAHEGWPYGGVGAEVVDRIQRLAFDELDAPVERVTTLDFPMPYNAKLEQYVVPQASRVVSAAKRALYR